MNDEPIYEDHLKRVLREAKERGEEPTSVEVTDRLRKLLESEEFTWIPRRARDQLLLYRDEPLCKGDLITIPAIAKTMREVAFCIKRVADYKIKIPEKVILYQAKSLKAEIEVLCERLDEISVGDCRPKINQAFLVSKQNLQEIIDSPQEWIDIHAKDGKEIVYPHVYVWMRKDDAVRCSELLIDAADSFEAAGETASREWITTAQACALTGKTPSQISKLCSDGTIRSFGTHKGKRIDANSLARWFTDERDKKVSDGESIEVVQRAMDQHDTNGPS